MYRNYLAAAGWRSRNSSAEGSETPKIEGKERRPADMHGLAMLSDNAAHSNEAYRLIKSDDMVDSEPPNSATLASSRTNEGPVIVTLGSGEEQVKNDVKQLQMPCIVTPEARFPAPGSQLPLDVGVRAASTASPRTAWGDPVLTVNVRVTTSLVDTDVVNAVSDHGCCQRCQ